MVHRHRLGNRPTAFAGLKALEGLFPLIIGELGLAPEPNALGLGRAAAVVGALEDPLALVLGHGAEKGDEAAAERRGEIEVGFVQNLDEGAAGVDALDEVIPSNIERVTRSHSATTRMSPVPSASMARSSSGRFLTDLPLAFSR